MSNSVEFHECVAFGNYMDSLGENLLPPELQHTARKKHEYPYSYDPLLIYEKRSVERNSTLYSDRLLQWDRDLHDRLCIKHFGNKCQFWRDRHPTKVQAFLQDWCESTEVQLSRIVEYCNSATGYPCWRFDYYKPKQRAKL